MVYKPIAYLKPNPSGRDFVVGDIHGCYDFLAEALAQLGFDPEHDRLISVGDLVDRGPLPEKALDYLSQPWFFAVMGNHEQIFMRAVDEKGKADHAFIDSVNSSNGLGWIKATDQDVLIKMREAFAKLPYALELESEQGLIGFIHAEVPKGFSWSEVKEALQAGDDKVKNSLLWSRARVREKDETGVEGLYRLYVGHTIQSQNILMLGNCFYIDTGAFARHRLDTKDDQNFGLTLAQVTALKESFNYNTQLKAEGRVRLIADHQISAPKHKSI
jgi:serine/threonine protein phosphatase 1